MLWNGVGVGGTFSFSIIFLSFLFDQDLYNLCISIHLSNMSKTPMLAQGEDDPFRQFSVFRIVFIFQPWSFYPLSVSLCLVLSFYPAFSFLHLALIFKFAFLWPFIYIWLCAIFYLFFFVFYPSLKHYFWILFYSVCCVSLIFRNLSSLFHLLSFLIFSSYSSFILNSLAYILFLTFFLYLEIAILFVLFFEGPTFSKKRLLYMFHLSRIRANITMISARFWSNSLRNYQQFLTENEIAVDIFTNPLANREDPLCKI